LGEALPADRHDPLSGQYADRHDLLSGQYPARLDPLSGKASACDDPLSGKYPASLDSLSGQYPARLDPLSGKASACDDPLGGQYPASLDPLSGKATACDDSLSGKYPASPDSLPDQSAETGSGVPAEIPGGSGRPIRGGEYQGLELVTGSRTWYLGQNERLTKTLLALAIATLASLALLACALVFRPEPRYFAVTADLRVLEMPPLDEPVVSDQAILNWSAEALTKSLSLNFLSWRRTLLEIRGDFDSRGYNSYVKALEEAGHIKKIEAERLSISCVVSGAPVVVESALKRGVMTWRLQTPLTLSFESSAGVVGTQRLLAEVVVRRAPTTQTPRGVVIHQVILGPAI
jgi:intracellular multiplication protein IcmL